MDKIERCIMQILWINCSVPDWKLYLIEKYTKSTCPQRCWIRGKVILPPSPSTEIEIASMTYNPTTGIVTITETNWDIYTVNLSGYSVTQNVLPNGSIQLIQNGNVITTITQWGWPVVIPKETSYWITPHVSPQQWDRRVDISWWLPWIDKVWTWTAWTVVVWASSPAASNVIWIPYTPVTNSWVWSYAQVVIPLTVPVWYTFDYIEYFTNWQYWLAVFNWSWFDVTSNKSATVWFENYLYYNEYWFLWSNQWSFITYSTPTSATITLYVLDTAAVANISWIWSIHYK